MDGADKKLAEQLIMDKINSNISSQQNIAGACSNSVQKQIMNPLDPFLSECGLTRSSSLTTPKSHDRLSAKEEILFYLNKVPTGYSFEKFWNRYKSTLPSMFALTQSYNIRPATSVASERLFSSANYVQRKHRSSLAPSTLKYSMVLRDQKILSNLVNAHNQFETMYNA